MPAVVPLESNPEVFSALAHKLGVLPLLEFHDVYSLTDETLLAMVPRPTTAVVLLFPLTTAFELGRRHEDDGQPPYDQELYGEVAWLKQTLKNGCGLYALLHAGLNLQDGLIVADSPLAQLKADSVRSDEEGNPVPRLVQEVALLVEQLEKRTELYSEAAAGGQTEAPPAGEDVYLHFLCFVHGKDGRVYELDGRRPGPRVLGQSEAADVLAEPAVVARVTSMMNNADSDNQLKFAIMALAPGE